MTVADATQMLVEIASLLACQRTPAEQKASVIVRKAAEDLSNVEREDTEKQAQHRYGKQR